MDLASLGWSADWQSRFAAVAKEGWMPGRVATEGKHAYVVFTEQGSWSAVIPGRMLHQTPDAAALPKVGDWVAIRPLPEGEKGVIESVLPRQTKLRRKVVGRTNEEQILASNVDLAFVVMALDPTYNLRRLERFLVMTREGGCVPVIVLNKVDLADERRQLEVEARAVAGEAELVCVSARTGEGLAALQRFIRAGRTLAFIGTSGVGKSSLINCLYGEEIQATLDVRGIDAKGRHATTWRELILLPQGGVVVDTPGMREFHMWAAQGGLEDAFADVEARATQCHFRACSHTVEKRCAVRAALESGELDAARYQSYLKLKHELEYLAQERSQHTFRGQRRRTVQRNEGRLR